MQQGPIKMRSLRKIYDQKEEDGETNLFYSYADHEPLTFKEAKEEFYWQLAIDEKIYAIQKNNTWELTILSQNHKAIGVRWVHKIKHTEDREVDRYKARLVAKGYRQMCGINYEEVFTPEVRHQLWSSF